MAMKRFVAAILGAALIPAATSFAAAEEKTITGLIIDEQRNCLQSPMKVPEHSGPEWDRETCVLYWAHNTNPPDKMVLYDPDTKMSYQLDSEDLVLPYAGDTQKVKVTGSYDDGKKTLHATRVQP
jgi:hypothetical protein